MPRRRSAPSPAALVRAQRAIEAFDLAAGSGDVVYALREVHRGRYRSHLWTVPWEGGSARRLTDGNVRDGSPAISPDGRRVAFTRTPVVDNPPDGQVWVVPIAGGRARRLARLPHGASSPRWSPDGTSIAVLGPAGERRFAIGPEKKDVAPTARVMRRTDFRDDESGFLSRRTHLWTLPADGGAAHQVTSGDFDVTHHSWSPDGRHLVFAADPGPDANLTPRQRIFRVAAGGGRVREVASLAGDADHPAIAPDGRQLAFIGTDVEDPPDHVLPGLWVVPLRGGAPAELTAGLDRSVGLDAWADLVAAEDVPGPVWVADGSILAMISDRGRNLPYRISADGPPRPLVDPAQRVVGAGIIAAAAPDGGERVAMSAAVAGAAAEIWALEPTSTERRRMRRLTRHGSSWMNALPRPRWEEAEVAGPGGGIQVWIASPDTRAGGDGQPLPTVMIIHGGPTGAHAATGNMDALMLTARGYRVIQPNIRGSATFGADWISALDGRWGDVDAADAMAVMDAMVRDGLADPDRLGVMGLSYGGYLTQWLVGVTDRFGAAVAENGVSNQASTWANSYFGVHYNRRANLGDPLSRDGMLKLWGTSPMANVANIRTPLLMLQAEEDRVCPAADNEQLFTALRVLGREVEYVLYPEEHHEMKMYGRPDRRIDRMERILGWFDRWIGPRATRGGSGGR